MKEIKADTYSIFFEDRFYRSLELFLNDEFYSSIFILVDSNTKKYCLPVFLSKIPSKLDYQIIEIPAGEKFKNLETCKQVWKELTNKKADRKSVIFHLGGGVVTDLGGFTSSTFKRGVKFINFPTTLLGMVDASVGGKTGVDFEDIKNQIGLFANPELLIVDFSFLKTLNKRQIYSGLAEIIKYGLTYDFNLWKDLNKKKPFSNKDLIDWVYRSVEIKNQIVINDPKENATRKILNFGHTIGHAIESFFLENKTKDTILHGEAVAAGLIMETYLSVKLLGLKKENLKELEKLIFSYFNKINYSKKEYISFLQLIQHDKKNINGEVLFTLIEEIGKSKWNLKVPENLIIESFDYYKSL
jgi:3-dehydroquinate synthase